MYTICESYAPFFPFLVASIRSGYSEGIDVKSSHAHEIAAAFFGYRSYSAAKNAGLDKQIGIFLPLNQGKTPQFRFYTQTFVDTAKSRICKLLPNISDNQVIEIINRLDYFYELECDKVDGFIARISRQLAVLYDIESGEFENYVFVSDEDWMIANEIVFLDDYIPNTFCSTPWSEFEVLPLSKPLPIGDNLHQFNVDIFANIISFLKPDFVLSFLPNDTSR
tara:strand:+ start:3397 stop:4062 length:666 start_codon:yes stop_codon:yes gene_type:complete